MVSVCLTADSVRMVVAEGQIIAEHSRRFGRDQLVCDPWHYLPVFGEKAQCTPQAWCAVSDLGFTGFDQGGSGSHSQTRQGDRAFVDLLLMARSLGDSGLETLEVACDLTLQTGVISSAIVLNEMRRLIEAAKPKPLTDIPPSVPTLTLEPLADCSRYDTLRSARHVH